MEKEPGTSSPLEERAGTSEEAVKAEALALKEKLARAGLFRDDDDRTYAKQAEWMIYCELNIESMCKLADIDRLVRTNVEDRHELLQEVMLHFQAIHVSPWNVIIEADWRIGELGGVPFVSAGESASVFEALLRGVVRFREACEDREVLVGWLEVWSATSRLQAELISMGGRNSPPS